MRPKWRKSHRYLVASIRRARHLAVLRHRMMVDDQRCG
jgi:hypothetical protein